MQSKEYRIGNWVNYNGKPYQIETIAKEYPTLNTDEFGIGVVDWNNIEPIPLTEEILLKCGYIACSFRENHFVIKGHTIWKCNDLLMCDKNGIIIKYLHQLQNLYFALTQEELPCIL